jgi:hypothetical protein
VERIRPKSIIHSYANHLGVRRHDLWKGTTAALSITNIITTNPFRPPPFPFHPPVTTDTMLRKMCFAVRSNSLSQARRLRFQSKTFISRTTLSRDAIINGRKRARSATPACIPPQGETDCSRRWNNGQTWPTSVPPYIIGGPHSRE